MGTGQSQAAISAPESGLYSKMEPGLTPGWQRAAVLGSLWAATEIIVGSTLHNLHLPLAGLLLSACAVTLLIGGHYLRPERGLFWRSGLVCALLKGLSPSAIIVGPMVAILMEALILEAGVSLLGSPWGYLPAGALAVSWSLIHKFLSLFMVYGPNLLDLYLRLGTYLARQWGLSQPETFPNYLVGTLFGFCGILGALAAVLGVFLAQRARQINPSDLNPDLLASKPPCPLRVFSSTPSPKLPFLGLHLGALFTGLALLDHLPWPYALGVVALYALFTLTRYQLGPRFFYRPSFWGLLLVSLIWIYLLAQLSGLSPAKGFSLGVHLCLRAVFMLLVFTALAHELSHPFLRAWLSKQGLSPLAQALPLAFATLPAMTQTLVSGRKDLFKAPLDTLALWLRQIDAYAEHLGATDCARDLET